MQYRVLNDVAGKFPLPFHFINLHLFWSSVTTVKTFMYVYVYINAFRKYLRLYVNNVSTI